MAEHQEEIDLFNSDKGWGETNITSTSLPALAVEPSAKKQKPKQNESTFSVPLQFTAARIARII